MRPHSIRRHIFDEILRAQRGPGATYHVSGHLDLTEAEFIEHYVPKLEAAIADPHALFVVGDARGADDMAQQWLRGHLGREAQDRVVVFHMLDEPRHHNDFDHVGGFKSDDERDAAMTGASSVDIAWVRPGRERSGTAKNLARRSAAWAR